MDHHAGDLLSSLAACGDIAALHEVMIFPQRRWMVPTLDARKLADIAAVIKAAREDKGISQAELARRLAFSRDYMVDLESGKPNMYMTRLFRVLHELGIVVTLEYGDRHGES